MEHVRRHRIRRRRPAQSPAFRPVGHLDRGHGWLGPRTA